MSDSEATRTARRLAQLLDAAVCIPGTQIRIGLDALLGLIPGIGDLSGAVLSGSIVLTAARLGAPPTVLLRMLFNLGIDLLIGAVPVLGDLFDLGWRANLRNASLLEAHVAEPGRTRRASRGVIASVILALVLMALGGLALLLWVTARLLQMLA